jgi:hemolysin activation/secretion protein
MWLRIVGFWGGVAIEGAIACVFSQGAIAAVLTNSSVLFTEALRIKTPLASPLLSHVQPHSTPIQKPEIITSDLVVESLPIETAALPRSETLLQTSDVEAQTLKPDSAYSLNPHHQLLESDSAAFKLNPVAANLIKKIEVLPSRESTSQINLTLLNQTIPDSPYLRNRHGKLIDPEPFVKVTPEPIIQISDIELEPIREQKNQESRGNVEANIPQLLKPFVPVQTLARATDSDQGVTIQATDIGLQNPHPTEKQQTSKLSSTLEASAIQATTLGGKTDNKLESNIATSAAFLLAPASSPQTLAQTPTPPAPSQIPPQPDPNRDRFLQPLPIPAPVVPEQPPSVTPTPTPAPTPSPEPSSQSIQVNKIEVVGSTVLSPEQLSEITKPLEGRSVPIESLREAADKITQLYLNRGDITSRAVLVDQAITNGVVQIRVLEGSLERIDVEGTRRLNPNYIRSRINLGAGTPLNTGKLEDQLRLLRADPLLQNVEASLRSGTGVGQSILVVRVTEAEPFQAFINIDNYSPPSVGSERLGTSLLYRNLTGRGDEVDASYNHTTTGGADTVDLSYRLPLNPMNGTLQLRTSLNRNHVTQPPFEQFNIHGESELYEISYRQPLVRSPREELALSLGFAYQNGQTFTFAGPTPFGIGPDENGVSRTSVLKFGQDYVRRDVRGAWSVRSLFSLGTGLFDATINPDPKPDGRFLAWLGQIQRVQVLNNDNFLIVQGDIQLTPNSLLPSQQFVIGGGQSLRGYRQNVRAGDNGVRLSLEDRITIQRDPAGVPTMILAPFIDAGWIWNQPDNPNVLQSEQFLAGTGIGLIWTPLPRLNLRLDYGLPLVPIKDRGTNAQDQGLYFSVNYQL